MKSGCIIRVALKAEKNGFFPPFLKLSEML